MQSNPGVASRFMGVAVDVGMNMAAAAAGAYIPGVSKTKAKKILKEVRAGAAEHLARCCNVRMLLHVRFIWLSPHILSCWLRTRCE